MQNQALPCLVLNDISLRKGSLNKRPKRKYDDIVYSEHCELFGNQP